MIGPVVATRAGGRAASKPRSEGAIQREIFDWLEAVLIPSEAFAYANPNASRRTPGGYASNAVPGLTKGIPDLSVVTTGGKLLFLEVKNAKGVLSEEQEEIEARCHRMGVPHAVVRGVEDVRAALAEHGISTREVSHV